jgi:pimeloyl-ACP methyl ester carboxylesterase
VETIERRISAWDGLGLRAVEWRNGAPGNKLPLLCLPGLVRTADDFARLAEALGVPCRIVAVDYAGRGASGRARDVARYAPEACLRDVTDICTALHLKRVAIIGTSFGGLLAMGLAAARPTLVAAVVLNDIGPEIGTSGFDFVARFIGRETAFATLAEAVAFLKAELPPMSLKSDEDWDYMARLTYQTGADGRWHPNWDTRIARTLNGAIPDLWRLFRGLAAVPLLLLRGGASDLLLPETVARMRQARPDIAVVELPGIGHAPTLFEPDCISAIRHFLANLE